MSDEEIDDMVKEAASQHHATYNDKAWEKMNALLEVHLPKKRGGRRFIYFLFLFLLTGVGIYLSLFRFKSNKISHPYAESHINPGSNAKNSPLVQNDREQNRINSTGIQKGQKEKVAVAEIKDVVPNNILKQVIEKSEGDKKFKVLLNSRKRLKIFTSNPFSETTGNQPVDQKISTPERFIEGIDYNKKTATINSRLLPPETGNPKPLIQESNNAKIVPENISVTKKDAKENTELEKVGLSSAGNVKKKNKHPIAGNFGIHFSAGPELSFIGLNQPGPSRITYGAGVGYTFGKRITIEAGLYISRKIYKANPGDYHPPVVFWTYYTDLKRIEADCKVYEIPVMVSYGFIPHNKHNWFISGGVSSYLMKTEKYNYEYKNLSGQSVYQSYSLSNENKHYFSVMTLSGGYQYNLNNRISFSAAPFIKLPLTGIGYGRVKLNGTGILFTATMRPFNKKN